MEKVSSVNDLISRLPKNRERIIWNVVIEGKIVQAVSATDNRRSTAAKYIGNKYPGKVFTLVFAEWRS